MSEHLGFKTLLLWWFPNQTISDDNTCLPKPLSWALAVLGGFQNSGYPFGDPNSKD